MNMTAPASTRRRKVARVAAIIAMACVACGCGGTHVSWTRTTSAGQRVPVGASGLSLVMPPGAGYVVKEHTEAGVADHSGAPTPFLCPDEVVFRRPPLWLTGVQVTSFARSRDWLLDLFFNHSQVLAFSPGDDETAVVVYWDPDGGPFKPVLISTQLPGRADGAILVDRNFATRRAAWNEADRVWRGLKVEGATLPPYLPEDPVNEGGIDFTVP